MECNIRSLVFLWYEMRYIKRIPGKSDDPYTSYIMRRPTPYEPPPQIVELSFSRAHFFQPQIQPV